MAQITSDRIVQSKLSLKEVQNNVYLSTFLLGRLLQHKDKQLIVDCLTGCQWTGKELYEVCLSLADAFINEFDLNIGDTVCFWCPNSDVHSIAFLATIVSGATYVAIDLNYSLNDIRRVIKLSSAKFLICLSDNSRQALTLLKESTTLKHLFIIDGNTDDCVYEQINCNFLMQFMRYKYKPEADSLTKPVPIPVPVAATDICCMHFVKQTRDGVPNQLIPIIRTNANLIQSASQLHDSQILALTDDDCIVGQHFADYLGVVLFCHTLVSGTKIAFTNSYFTRQKALGFVGKYRITCASIDLSELLYMLRNDVDIHNYSKSSIDFSSLTDILHTGSPLPHSDCIVEEVFKKLCPKYFRSIYGTPETGVISCKWRVMATECVYVCPTSYFSVGYPVPGVQIKVIHPQTEKPRMANKIGEICVKSAQTIDKTRNLSVVTRNAFTIDGFYKTGDAGYYDSDGQLYVECRVNELIYEGQDVVNPQNIERLFKQHYAVKEAVVIGVDNTCGGQESDGQICCAFVELANKHTVVTGQTLKEFVATKGRELKGDVIFIDEIPLTYRSQVNRMALRVIYNNLHTYSLIEML
ncbi:uncharacterized protein LOC128952161 [Oppia nitens]|uniref:uncharacterized protein LOC128952161 n=1 Tax=Oppia nitens TaxID=1686743 RepID=UPI0023DC45F0|nr:uncharacterized protein LOC128952161 [Oppia nitens]